jgi:hypothetical protein
MGSLGSADLPLRPVHGQGEDGDHQPCGAKGEAGQDVREVVRTEVDPAEADQRDERDRPATETTRARPVARLWRSTIMSAP